MIKRLFKRTVKLFGKVTFIKTSAGLEAAE